jgi:iron complex transport system substrate-binding protein
LTDTAVPRRSRRLLVAGALVASLALTACGSDDDEATTTPASDASGTRTVQTAMGPVEITGTPKRVVVLDTPELDTTTTLGVTPVGTVKAAIGDGFPRYLADKAKGIEVVGEIEAPNLVAIAKLKPDLILSSKVRDEKRYAQLSKIAPTVFTETPADWKANVITQAEALGKAGEARRLLTDYEQRAKAVGRALGDPAETTVSVVRWLPGEIRLYSPNSFVGSILKDVGVALPPAAEKASDINATLSLENLDEADADVVYQTVYGPAKDTDQARGTKLPAWKDIDAVEDGRVYDEPDDVWMLGIGITGAQQVLNELEKTLPAAQSR